jgi:hypothetical protein
VNYGILSASVPHVDLDRQKRSSRPQGGSMASQGWHTQPGRTSSNVNFAVGLIALSPIVMGEPGVLDLLGFEVITAVAGGTARLALYDSDPFGFPAWLRGRFSFGNSDTADLSAAGFKNAQVGLLLEQGTYWGALIDSVAGALALRSFEGTSLDSAHLAASGQASAIAPPSGYLSTIAFGDFPGHMGSTRLGAMSSAPRLSWKVTS